MYGPVINGKFVVDIEYNHTQSLISSNCKNIVFFGHLACDKQDNGSSTIIILLYDLLLESEHNMQVEERYKIVHA